LTVSVSLRPMASKFSMRLEAPVPGTALWLMRGGQPGKVEECTKVTRGPRFPHSLCKRCRP
jgi:hypothetical protein